MHDGSSNSSPVDEVLRRQGHRRLEPGSTGPPQPDRPVVRYVESVSPYRVASECTFGGPIRYEAEAPTAEEARELLRSLASEKHIGGMAAEISARHGLEELKKERDELHERLWAVLSKTYARGVCFACGHLREEMHDPDCVVTIAGLLLGRIRDKGDADD